MTLTAPVWSQSNSKNLPLSQLQQEKRKVDKKIDSVRSFATKDMHKLASLDSTLAVTKSLNTVHIEDGKGTKAEEIKIKNLQKQETAQQTKFDRQLLLLDSLMTRQSFLDSVIKVRTGAQKIADH